MRSNGGGEYVPRLVRFIPALAAGVLVGTIGLFFQDLKARQSWEESRPFSLAVEWDDVSRGVTEDEALARLALLRDIPVAAVAVLSDQTNVPVTDFKALGFSVLTHADEPDDAAAALAVLSAGGAVIPSEELMRERPDSFSALITAAKTGGGRLLLPDIPLRPLPGALLRVAAPISLKMHAPRTAETAAFDESRWTARYWRAYKERGVGVGLIRRGAELEFSSFQEFLTTLSTLFSHKHLPLSNDLALREATWVPTGLNGSQRLMVALGLSILIPIVMIFWLSRISVDSPAGVFLLMSGISVLTGIAIHALGSTPLAVEGIERFRGVKLQLLLPALAAPLLLSSLSSWKTILDRPLRVKHALLFAIVAVAGWIYVSRSGNTPAIPVTGWELDLRDWLDRTLAARPRFKEIFFGHPLLLLGLFLLRRGRDNAWPRVFLVAGILGQVSIINSFTHFHTGLDVALLRSLHGLWIGGLLGLLACATVERFSAPPSTGERSTYRPLRNKRRVPV